VKLYAWTKIERCAPAICSTTSSVQSWPGVKQTVQAGCSAWPAGAANRSAAARPAAIAKSVARDSPEYLRAIDYLGSPPRSTARPPLCSTPVPRPTSQPRRNPPPHRRNRGRRQVARVHHPRTGTLVDRAHCGSSIGPFRETLYGCLPLSGAAAFQFPGGVVALARVVIASFTVAQAGALIRRIAKRLEAQLWKRMRARHRCPPTLATTAALI
jgi:hypothetical protein